MTDSFCNWKLVTFEPLQHPDDSHLDLLCVSACYLLLSILLWTVSTQWAGTVSMELASCSNRSAAIQVDYRSVCRKMMKTFASFALDVDANPESQGGGVTYVQPGFTTSRSAFPATATEMGLSQGSVTLRLGLASAR